MKTALKKLLNKKYAAGMAAGLLLAAQPVAAEVLTPFEADYTVTRGSLTLGDGHFSLKPWGKKDKCYIYHGEAKPRALLRFIVGDITDDSYFCTSAAQPIQSQYFRHVEESDAEDTHTLTFEWKSNKVIYAGDKAKNGTATLSLPDDAVDPNALHMAARLWLAQMDDYTQHAERKFAIVDENEIKHYTLATSPGGVIETPIGKFETVKISRIDDPKKQFTLWAAPKLDFLPIQVESKKRDDPIIRLSIKSYKRRD